MTLEQEKLKRRQAAAKIVHERMLEAVIGFSPCGKLTIDDALFLARTAQTLAFEATESAA